MSLEALRDPMDDPEGGVFSNDTGAFNESQRNQKEN